MDNLSSHKVARVRELIEETGAELRYLPPYSPDLNPIENVFSKIKQQTAKPGPPNPGRVVGGHAVRAGHRDRLGRRELLPTRRIYATDEVKLL